MRRIRGTNFQELYIGIKVVSGMGDLLILVITFPILIYNLRKYHRTEYLIHRLGLCAYYLGMIMYVSAMF